MKFNNLLNIYILAFFEIEKYRVLIDLMDKDLFHITSRNLVYCNRDCKISRIAKMLLDNWTDTVLLKENNEVIGIVTDGIIWDLISKEDPRIYDYTAKEIMDKNIITIELKKDFDFIDASLREKIEKNPTKRLIVKKDNQIIGMIQKKILEKIKRHAKTFNVEFKE